MLQIKLPLRGKIKYPHSTAAVQDQISASDSSVIILYYNSKTDVKVWHDRTQDGTGIVFVTFIFATDLPYSGCRHSEDSAARACLECSLLTCYYGVIPFGDSLCPLPSRLALPCLALPQRLPPSTKFCFVRPFYSILKMGLGR